MLARAVRSIRASKSPSILEDTSLCRTLEKVKHRLAQLCKFGILDSQAYEVEILAAVGLMNKGKYERHQLPCRKSHR